MENRQPNEKMLKKLKLHIAMSEFGKEYTMDKKTREIRNINFIKKVAIFIIAIGILVISGVQAKRLMKEFTNRETAYITKSISEAITDGYVENIDMEYIYSDGVGFKINSFSMSDNDINLTFDFKLNDKTKLNGEMMEYAYILYNENNEVYYINKGTNRNLLKEFKKDTNIKLANKDLDLHFLTGQSVYVTYTEDNLVVNELMSAKDYFPKAKKLYLKVVGIGYKTENERYKKLSNSEWNIELNIPDKFYLDSSICYDAKENIEGIHIEKLQVSGTSTNLTATIKGFDVNSRIYVVDENGNEYQTNAIHYNALKKDEITVKFPIRKANLTNKMYLKVIVDDKEKKVELIRK